MISRRICNSLALLVGSNPLPNYIAAVVLSPQRVVLLHSPETTGPRDRLRDALLSKDSRMQISSRCIDDATDVRRIQDACQSLDVDHLHYSGGTKPMAAHARITCGLQDEQASYLDERNSVLRFDDGVTIDLATCDLKLTLDIVMKLHDIERKPSSSQIEGGPTEHDVEALAAKVLAQPDLAKKLRDHFRPGDTKRSIEEAKKVLWTANDHEIILSVSSIPDHDWKSARYRRWDDFLCGTWLEPWAATQVRTCLDAMGPAVEVDVKCVRQRPIRTEFQIDVALVRGHRLYVVSCTTDGKPYLCKSKLFEVAVRSRQMGGDLARSALVCLLDKGPKGEDYVEQLRSDIKSSFLDAPNHPEVFGLRDLREWAGTSSAPNLGTLNQWLQS